MKVAGAVAFWLENQKSNSRKNTIRGYEVIIRNSADNSWTGISMRSTQMRSYHSRIRLQGTESSTPTRALWFP